jgi:autotransporter-associated beta strand protein
MKKLSLLIVGLAFVSTNLFGTTLMFWDTNGTEPGAGGSNPTGTWGVDAFWNEDSAGGAAKDGTKAWKDGDLAVFAAGNDAVGAYTVQVSGIIDVGDIHVDRGDVTFEAVPETGASLKLGKLLSVGAFDDNAVARYNVPITTSTGVVRYKVGTVVFGATNTFTGSLTIESGLTLCAVPNCFSAAPSLVLANLDMGRTDVSPFWELWAAVFQTGGFDQQLGTLKFAGTNAAVERSLDLGYGAGTLSFADSSAEDWSGYTLSVKNYALGTSKLRFGTSKTGLTEAQLSQIQFADYEFANAPAVIDSNGYVSPGTRIKAITHSGGSVELAWAAFSGMTYRVWSKDTLAPGPWNNLGDVPANDTTAYYIDFSPSPTGRFYQVELLLP